MRVALNGVLIGSGRTYRRTGVSRYIASLVDHLPGALGTEDELVVVGRPGEPDGDDKPASPGERLRRHPAGRILWEQTALPVLARRERWDLLHSPVNVAPALLPGRSVVTVHDLAFVTAPSAVPAHRRRYLTAMTAHSVRHAARVIAVSKSTRHDLGTWFDVAPDRISVTPLAAEPRFRPPSPPALAAFRERHRIDQPYILSVGTREPRKNVAALVRAFARLAAGIPHGLVLVGPPGWMGGDLDRALADLPSAVRDRVRLTGFVDDDDLPLWYGGADVFAYPAHYEGFGLPVLEAMACGVPVVTSDVSSLPEVAGDAALLVDPEDEEELAAALLEVITDARLAMALRDRGLRRAAEFSWSETARLTVNAYRAALGR